MNKKKRSITKCLNSILDVMENKFVTNLNSRRNIIIIILYFIGQNKYVLSFLYDKNDSVATEFNFVHTQLILCTIKTQLAPRRTFFFYIILS